MDEIVAYLTRLTGEPVTPDTPIRLRSVQRAALGSWARRAGIAVAPALIRSDAPFRVRDLLGAEGQASGETPPPVAAVPAFAPETLGRADAVGIDIEDVDGLPQADDYREHPFYIDHFTPAEIAYCIRQRNAAASFCGIWAAKEAMLKAGLFDGAADRMGAIEIGRDPEGRPVHPGCSLSISHTGRTAIAICMVRPPASVPAAAAAPVPPPPRADAQREDASAAVAERRPRRAAMHAAMMLAAAAAISVVAAAGFVFWS